MKKEIYKVIYEKTGKVISVGSKQEIADIYGVDTIAIEKIINSNGLLLGNFKIIDGKQGGTDEVRKQAQELRDQGLSYSKIGKALNVSAQYVQVLINQEKYNDEHHKKMRSEYGKKHRNEISAYYKKWRDENPNYHKEYYASNKEKIKEKRINKLKQSIQKEVITD